MLSHDATGMSKRLSATARRRQAPVLFGSHLSLLQAARRVVGVQRSRFVPVAGSAFSALFDLQGAGRRCSTMKRLPLSAVDGAGGHPTGSSGATGGSGARDRGARQEPARQPQWAYFEPSAFSALPRG